jgi:hypothetical protein
MSGQPSFERKSCNLLSSSCYLRQRISASGLLMERVKLVSGSNNFSATVLLLPPLLFTIRNATLSHVSRKLI